eukprot:11227066-Lingulodinium_polyedra.AAC.1
MLRAEGGGMSVPYLMFRCTRKSLSALRSVLIERGSRCVRSVCIVFGCVRTCMDSALELRMPRA